MKVYSAPEAELIKVDTRDIMSLSQGSIKDPFKGDIFGKRIIE